MKIFEKATDLNEVKEGISYNKLKVGDFYFPVRYPGQLWLKLEQGSIYLLGNPYFAPDANFIGDLQYRVLPNAAIIKDTNV